MTCVLFFLAGCFLVQYAWGQQQKEKDGSWNGVANCCGGLRSKYQWAFRDSGSLISSQELSLWNQM
jgi:hypothetical protein